MRVYVYTACVGFVAGIFVAYFLALGWSVGIFLLLLALILPFVSRERAVLITAVFLIATSLGIFRYEFWQVNQPALLPAQSVNIQAVVNDEPVEQDTGMRLTLKFTDDSMFKNKEAVVTLNGPQEFTYGDLISIKGNLTAVEATNVPDYWKEYLKLRGIQYEFKYASVSKIKSGAGNSAFSFLYGIKHTFLNKISELLPEPESSLVAGILIGARTTIGKEVLAEFNQTGVSHVVAISGYNITIIANAIGAVILYFGIPTAIGLGLSGVMIVLFVIMTGLSASAVRAAVMSVILLLAQKEGRTYDAGTALVVTALLMSLWNPLTPLYDFSFQLSFLAAAGIIWLSPVVGRLLVRAPALYGVKEILTGTIAAEAMIMPLIIYKTGIVSLISLLANILILPVVPTLMLLGAIMIVLGFIAYPVAFIALVPTHILLLYVLRVVSLAAHLPFAYLQIASLPTALMLIWYLAMLCLILYERKLPEILHKKALR